MYSYAIAKHSMVKAWFLPGLLLLSGWSPIAPAAELVSGGHLLDSVPVRSWQEIRDQGIVKQRFDYSCGAASLAGLLTYHYGMEVNELEVIDRVGLKQAFTMADLARAATEFGFKPVGLALDYQALTKISRPVIVYLNYREGHFSVLKGIDEHGVWLADPSWGNTKMRRAQFKRFWHSREQAGTPGRVLALFPAAGTEITTNDTLLSPMGGGGLQLPPLYFIKP